MCADNLYQLVLNAWCVAGFVQEVWAHGMPVWGNGFDGSSGSYRMSLLIWIHYNNKYVELLDTLFVVLRGSAVPHFGLQVYHHALVLPMITI